MFTKTCEHETGAILSNYFGSAVEDETFEDHKLRLVFIFVKRATADVFASNLHFTSYNVETASHSIRFLYYSESSASFLNPDIFQDSQRKSSDLLQSERLS